MIVVVTASVARSIFETVLLPELVTYANVPAGLITTRKGDDPTVIGEETLVARSIFETVPENLFDT